MTLMQSPYRIRLIELAMCLIAPLVFPAAASGTSVNLAQLSIEELMNIEVSTVSRKSVKLSAAPAAVFVVTQDDIHRAGITSIPEALRMVPGLEVGHVDANKWAITARGYNGLFANKLLVLIDGRSVYTPLFSGVFWETQDVLLEDVDRIEVVRGPGATLWGANAVNGVINIVTKSAAETQGGFALAGGGTRGSRIGAMRYGGKVGENIYYRAYLKHFDRGSFVRDSGADAYDAWHADRGGLRIDWDMSPASKLTVTGDYYRGEVGQTYSVIWQPRPPYRAVFDATGKTSGGHVLSRWKHSYANDGELTVQAYFDRTRRVEPILAGVADTYDFDMQHRFPVGDRNEFIWGVGYRLIRDRFDNTFTISLDPASRATSLASGFFQNESSYFDGRVRLTLGTKFEYKDIVGLAVQPNVRLLWTPSDRATLWAAVSRAVRTPSRVETDGRVASDVVPDSLLRAGSPPHLVFTVGTTKYKSEELLAYELGYRLTMSDRTFLDVAGYYNRYDRLRTLETGLPRRQPEDAPYLTVPLTLDNRLAARAYGAELFVEHRIAAWWTLQSAYTFLHIDARLDPSSSHIFGNLIEREIPTHQVFLRSSWTLPRNLDLDVQARYVAPLRGLEVDRYVAADGRIGWYLRESFELSLTAKNLLGNDHYENKPGFTGVVPTKAVRSVLASVAWRF